MFIPIVQVSMPGSFCFQINSCCKVFRVLYSDTTLRYAEYLAERVAETIPSESLTFFSSFYFPGVLVAAANSVGWNKRWEEILEARKPLRRLSWANRSSSLGWWISKVTQLIPSLFPLTKNRNVAVHCFNLSCFSRNMHYPDSMCTSIRRRGSKYECGRSGLLVIVRRGQLDRTFTVLRLLYL